jgi:hypothetical protein
MKKAADILEEFYGRDVMLTDDWKRPNFKLWHTCTRFAIHGFHGRARGTRTTTTLAQLAGVHYVATMAHDIIYGRGIQPFLFAYPQI